MRLRSILASTVFAAAATVLAAGSASAAPISFTWNPSASSGALSTAGAFTATNLTVKDYATINLSNLNNVTESGILVVTAIDAATPLQGFVNGSGLGAGGAIGGATPYQLYFTFNSTSTLAPAGGGAFSGQFTSLSYTLWGDVGGLCTFSTAGGAACGGSGAQLALATGTLSPLGLNNVSINSGGIPAANVNVDITLGANAGGFFVNPSDLTGFLFETAFTNTPGVVGHPSATVITINGGGGNVDMIPVPEPLTLSVFGAGLAGAVAMRRRKAKKA